MDATITFDSNDQAQFIADMPQLAANGHVVTVDGHTVTIDDEALAVLADIDPEHDGHYDGTHVWIGGSEYRVVRRTGRPPLDKDGTTRVSVTMPISVVAEIDRRGFTHGDRSTQIRRAVEEHLRGDFGAPTVTATADSDPRVIVDQVHDVLAYLRRTVSTVSAATTALQWMDDADEAIDHAAAAVEDAIGELYAALSQAETPYARLARAAECAAIPEDV